MDGGSFGKTRMHRSRKHLAAAIKWHHRACAAGHDKLCARRASFAEAGNQRSEGGPRGGRGAPALAATRAAGRWPVTKAVCMGKLTVAIDGGGGAMATHNEQSNRCSVGASEPSALLTTSLTAPLAAQTSCID